MTRYQQQYYIDNKEQIIKRTKQYNINHREEINARNRKYRKELRKFIQDYKLSHGCSVCGYNKCVGALEFHHEGDDKEFCISNAIRNYRGKAKTRKEMEKCIILCSNCHRELHEKLNEESDDGKDM